MMNGHSPGTRRFHAAFQDRNPIGHPRGGRVVRCPCPGAKCPGQPKSVADAGGPPAIQPSDQQLQRFASASQKVSGIVDEYRPKVDAAKSDAAKQKVVEEADAKMVKLVQADGLSVEEFNGIGRAVQQDPQLKQRLMSMGKAGAAVQ